MRPAGPATRVPRTPVLLGPLPRPAEAADIDRHSTIASAMSSSLDGRLSGSTLRRGILTAEPA